MKTEILEPTEENIETAGRYIKEGKLVAFPTETVYGLGGNALNGKAVKDIYIAKGRPSDNPMIVHIADVETLYELSKNVSADMEILAGMFWPGPLTMVTEKAGKIPYVTTGGLDTVGIRFPSNPVAQGLIKAAGLPVAAPSANLSGKPSPTRKEHVIDDLDGRVDCILTGDDSEIGIESTVVDMTEEIPVILRPGIITAGDLSRALGKEVRTDKGLVSDDEIPKAPGMKYRHYAPKAPMYIYQSGDSEKITAKIEAEKDRLKRQGKRVGVITFGADEYMKAAHDLFAGLREMDALGVDIILAGVYSWENEIGFAVMNRMLKSAGFNVEEL